MKCDYMGADWLQRNLSTEKPPRQMSAFGRDLADMLGNVFKGIYHIDEYVLRKSVDWTNQEFIEMPLDRELSTFDSSDLTELVLRCHAEGIRMEISVGKYSWKYEGRRGTKRCLMLRFHRLGAFGISGKHRMLRAAIETFVGPFCSVCQCMSRTCTHCGGSGHEPAAVPEKAAT